MRLLTAFLLAHPFWTGVVAMWVYSAAVQALPEPNGSGKGYKWLYQFLHALGANFMLAFGSKLPGMPPPKP